MPSPDVSPTGPGSPGPFFFMIDYAPPKPLKIKRLREQVSRKLNFSINQSRLWCAQACIVRPNLFLDWEAGTYEMPPGLFQLLQLKVMLIDADLLSPIAIPGRTYMQGALKFNALDPTPKRNSIPRKAPKKAS